MAFFTSEYECKLDAKGRLALPAKVKSNLPTVSTNELVIRKGLEPHLIIYPMLEYEKFHNKISALSEFNAEERKLKRNIFRGITHVELDSSGRILFPKAMLAHAKIDSEAIVIGMGDYFEIWNSKVLEDNSIDGMEEYSELAQKYLNDQ